jgi:hypothetical protein
VFAHVNREVFTTLNLTKFAIINRGTPVLVELLSAILQDGEKEEEVVANRADICEIVDQKLRSNSFVTSVKLTYITRDHDQPGPIHSHWGWEPIVDSPTIYWSRTVQVPKRAPTNPKARPPYLHDMIKKKDMNGIKAAIEAGASPDSVYWSCTPLVRARESAEVTELLCRSGASLNSLECFWYADLRPDVAIVLAKSGMDLFQISPKGRTILHALAQSENVSVLLCLASFGIGALAGYRDDDLALPGDIGLKTEIEACRKITFSLFMAEIIVVIPIKVIAELVLQYCFM